MFYIHLLQAQQAILPLYPGPTTSDDRPWRRFDRLPVKEEEKVEEVAEVVADIVLVAPSVFTQVPTVPEVVFTVPSVDAQLVEFYQAELTLDEAAQIAADVAEGEIQRRNLRLIEQAFDIDVQAITKDILLQVSEQLIAELRAKKKVKAEATRKKALLKLVLS